MSKNVIMPWFICFLSLVAACLPLKTRFPNEFVNEWTADAKSYDREEFKRRVQQSQENLIEFGLNSDESKSKFGGRGEAKSHLDESESSESNLEVMKFDSDESRSDLDESKSNSEETKSDSRESNLDQPKSDLRESHRDESEDKSKSGLEEPKVPLSVSKSKPNEAKKDLGEAYSEGEPGLDEAKLYFDKSSSNHDEFEPNSDEPRTKLNESNLEESKSDWGELEPNSGRAEADSRESIFDSDLDGANLGQSNADLGQSGLSEAKFNLTEAHLDKSKADLDESSSLEAKLGLDESKLPHYESEPDSNESVSDFKGPKLNTYELKSDSRESPSNLEEPKSNLGGADLDKSEAQVDLDEPRDTGKLALEESKTDGSNPAMGVSDLKSAKLDLLSLDLNQSEPKLTGLKEYSVFNDESKSDVGVSQTQFPNSDWIELSSNQSDCERTDFSAVSNSHLSLLNKLNESVLATASNKNFTRAVLLLIAAVDETCRNVTNRITGFYLDIPPTDTLLDVFVYANNLFCERVIVHVIFVNAFADEVLYELVTSTKNITRRSENGLALRFTEDIVEVLTSALNSNIAWALASLLLGLWASRDVVEKLLSFLN